MTLYADAKGVSYHRTPTCFRQRWRHPGDRPKVTQAEIESRGLRPCKVCKP